MEMTRKEAVVILISHKINFKTKAITKDIERHYKMIKWSIQEDITHINIYEPHENHKEILTEIKGEMDNHTIRVGNLNAPLTSINRSSRKKINKAIVILNDMID